MGDFLSIPHSVINEMFVEIDTNNSGEISQDEWITYILKCRANGMQTGNTLVNQLENENMKKVALSKNRFIDEKINIYDHDFKLNSAEIQHVKDLASKKVND